VLTVPKGVSQTSTVLVPFAPSSVAEARRVMATDLAGRDVPDFLVEDAMLVLSEILSNALKHAKPLPSGRVQVRWAPTPDGVEVEVTDGGAQTRPRATSATISATGGRGLSIVTDLSRDWGVRDEDGQTTVWALVAPRDGARRAGQAAAGAG
jgi:anti-sigma regulatory factor (Ser/Thr protein kinase)